MAFRLAGFRANVVSIEPPGDITPPEPIGLDEIINGAVRRSQYAINVVRNAEFGVGIEAGIIRVKGFEEGIDVTIAAVIDGSGKVTLGFSPGFMVPRKFMNEVLQGVELNDVVSRYYGGEPNIGRKYGLIGALTRRFIDRVILNTEAVYMALIPRLPWNAELFRD
ncbi:inosine/xanthosine triphosphatase [Vulcanisaeta distributa]|uniref:inosine/xanthosine triphosphatase n=1 Tax=Vulcanisaeta distributa TaxID=164451 RepID=UPI001FB4FCED|nr:inosine/xanthosine triphosphatase [Vulcanisaeta distributa]